MIIRRSTLLKFLNKELKSANSQLISNGDRRDWNATTDSASRVECIQMLISKMTSLPIIIKSSYINELQTYLSAQELMLDDVTKQDDDSYNEDEETDLWAKIYYIKSFITRVENMEF